MPMATSPLARSAQVCAARSPRVERGASCLPIIHSNRGCGFDPKYVQALLHKSGDAVVEAMFRRAMTAPVGGDQVSKEARARQSNADNVSIAPKHGNSRAYTLDRLQREQPELFTQVEAGKLSANAAAIEAGFRRKLTAFERVQKLLPELTAEQRRWLREALSKEITETVSGNAHI
jgi:hypothetical protein